MNFEEFDMQYGDLANDVNDYEENGGEFEEIPEGKYEVRLNNIEMKVSKNGNPMVTFDFEILSNDYKGRREFYNQVINQKYGIHSCNEMLKALCPEETQEEHLFKSFADYSELIDKVANASIDCEYCLEKIAGKNDFFNYKILEKY